jgi:hypothetical protein
MDHMPHGRVHMLLHSASGAVLVATLAITTRALPTVIYVNVAAEGANDGTSWKDAFNTLQDALVS